MQNCCGKVWNISNDVDVDKMRCHFHYGFVALIIVVVVLCFVSYHSFTPVKQSKLTRSKTSPDIVRLLHRNPALVIKEKSSNLRSKSSALRNTSEWINPAAAAADVAFAAAAANDDEGEDEIDNYSSFSSLNWQYYFNETSDIPKSTHSADKEKLKHSTDQSKNRGSKSSRFLKTTDGEETGTNILNSLPVKRTDLDFVSGGAPSNQNYLQNVNNLQIGNTNKDRIKFQKKVKLKNKSTSLINSIELNGDLQSTALGREQQQVLSNSNEVPHKDTKTSDLLISKNSNCTPKKNIVFFKTHKCATSTVQNIMFRYGDKHQLKFVLPKSKDHRFSLKQPFDRHQVLSSKRGKILEPFNIFTNHAIFNQAEIEAVMPPDSIYISILRNPVTMFESMYTYLRLNHQYAEDSSRHLVSMEEFLDDAPHFYQNWEKVYGGRYSRNPMLYDFGLRPESMDDVSKIDNLISVIDDRFDLIMIADYFEESLIMLKNLLCLDPSDISYLTFNVRSEESVHEISDSLAKKIRAWNWGDVRLFNHFNRTFHEKLKMLNGKQMKKEKRELEKRNKQLKKLCVADVAVDMESVWHPEGVKIEGFRLRDDQRDEKGICKMITRPEKVYTNILKERQTSPG